MSDKILTIVNNVFTYILIALSLVNAICSYTNPNYVSIKKLAVKFAILSMIFALQKTLDQLELKHTKSIKEV